MCPDFSQNKTSDFIFMLNMLPYIWYLILLCFAIYPPVFYMFFIAVVYPSCLRGHPCMPKKIPE